MPSFLQIVTNMPLWVWPLMLFVLWLGLQGLRPRVIPVWRLAILPVVGLTTSLAGIVQSMDPAAAATGWSLALLAFLPLGWTFGQGRPVRLRPGDGRLEMAGGWFGLLFGVSIFAVRYAMGVLFGVLPALRAEPLWIHASGAVGGAVAGIGIGWLANLLRRARRPTEGAPGALSSSSRWRFRPASRPSPSSASTSRCARTCSTAWTATRRRSTAP